MGYKTPPKTRYIGRFDGEVGVLHVRILGYIRGTTDVNRGEGAVERSVSTVEAAEFVVPILLELRIASICTQLGGVIRRNSATRPRPA
jgi:hypothetical protein